MTQEQASCEGCGRAVVVATVAGRDLCGRCRRQVVRAVEAKADGPYLALIARINSPELLGFGMQVSPGFRAR